MKTLNLNIDQIEIILESLTEMRIDLIIQQRKQLIELESKKNIDQEEYNAFVNFVEFKTSKIENIREQIFNQLKEQEDVES